MNSIAQQVPLMYRAQIDGRCQLHFINNENQIQQWVSEWIDRIPKRPYHWRDAPHQQTRTHRFNWRFVTNGGQDDGIIRPAIATDGLPFYPGSSMKGAFRNACTPEQIAKYCGRSLDGSHRPGRIPLRFHGGYPTDNNWRDRLIDLVHPQQEWQVKTPNTTDKPKGESAFALISLYRPEFRFCISSPQPLAESDWAEIWQIWDKAIASGLGCRTSAGYGQTTQTKSKLLYKTSLTGQGAAPKLLDEAQTPEFRPNCFRAALRGHALRLFGGLCDSEKQAESLVEILFGGVSDGGKAGLLSMNWEDTEEPYLVKLNQHARQPTYSYEVEGNLQWHLTRFLDRESKKKLTNLIATLTRFAMLFGGFGKSWRRSDHRLCFPQYEDIGRKLIGCHWNWLNHEKDNKISALAKVKKFINHTRQTFVSWMQLQNIEIPVSEGNFVNWRETWHPDNVQVWGREAQFEEDCKAVYWLHNSYQKSDPQLRISQKTIKQSSLTGKLNKIGRLWHRMYPRINGEFLELLVIFPHFKPEENKEETEAKKKQREQDQQQANDFLEFLRSHPDGFELLWGNR